MAISEPRKRAGAPQVIKETGEVTAPPAEGTELPPATTTSPPARVAPAMEEPAKPAAAVPGTYTIERGDTLAKIATKLYGAPWLVDSFLNEGGSGVKVRFRVVDFNLLCGIEGVALMNQQKP